MTQAQLDIDVIDRSGTELIRYRVSEGERSLIGKRRADGAEIYDTPASGEGPSYRVDGGYQDGITMQAFVEDYVAQAVRMDCCPMGAEAIDMIVADTEVARAEGVFTAFGQS
jgi:hypothetical protein